VSIGLALTAVPCPSAAQQISPKLTAVDQEMMVSAAEIQNWLDRKDSWGPAYTGGPAWKKFMELIHAEMKSMGLVNLVDYSFPYTRWYTTEFPDKTGWSLSSDGAPVEVASYGTQSGSTGPGGITASMILYDLAVPVEQRPPLSALTAKIVVVKQQPYDTLGTPQRRPIGVGVPTTPSAYCGNPPACKPPVPGAGPPSPQWGNPGPLMAHMDYEYRADPDTYPTPLFERTPVNVEASFRNRDQFGQIREVITNVLVPSGAVGAVMVMDLSPLAAAGARIHPTPRQFNVPLLMLDRVAGAKVLADAAAGKTGKLVLDAHEESNAQAYQVAATLPGRNYGTASDQSILLATHVDGPSVVEDDGALGILAALRYYSRIPQSERPKSIVAFFDTRHFVAGTEASYPFDLVIARPGPVQDRGGRRGHGAFRRPAIRREWQCLCGDRQGRHDLYLGLAEPAGDRGGQQCHQGSARAARHQRRAGPPGPKRQAAARLARRRLFALPGRSRRLARLAHFGRLAERQLPGLLPGRQEPGQRGHLPQAGIRRGTARQCPDGQGRDRAGASVGLSAGGGLDARRQSLRRQSGAGGRPRHAGQGF
jgi:hypothetical protein